MEWSIFSQSGSSPQPDLHKHARTMCRSPEQGLYKHLSCNNLRTLDRIAVVAKLLVSLHNADHDTGCLSLAVDANRLNCAMSTSLAAENKCPSSTLKSPP